MSRKLTLDEFFSRQNARVAEKLQASEERLALRLQQLRQDRKSRLEDTLASDDEIFESRGHARGRKKPRLDQLDKETE